MNEYTAEVEFEQPTIRDEKDEKDETDEIEDVDELKAEAIRLWKEGMTLKDIAERLALSQATISRWCRGVPRGRSKAKSTSKKTPVATGEEIKVSSVKVPPELYALYKYFKEKGYKGDISQFLVDYAKWGVENKEGVMYGIIKKEGDTMPIPEFKLKSEEKEEKKSSKDVFDDLMELVKKQMSIELTMSMIDKLSKSKKGNDIDINELLKMMLMKEFVSGKKESMDIANAILLTMLKEKRSGIDTNTLMVLDKLTNKQSLDPTILMLLASKSKGSNMEETLKWLEKLEAMRAKIEEEREKRRLEELKRLEDNFRHQFEKIAEQVAAGRITPKDAAKEILEYIKVGKELAGEIKTAESGKSNLAADLIKSTIEAIKEPVLKPMGQALATKMTNPQPKVIAVPKEALEKMKKPETPPVKEIPEEGEEYSKLIQISGA